MPCTPFTLSARANYRGDCSGEAGPSARPVSSRSFTIAGIVYYFAHQYDQALAQFQRAYKLEPNPPAFLFPFELGVIYAEKGMYGNAIGEFKKLGDQPTL
jgi:tetratricopeptide (TPR) repeat protein